MKVIKINAMWCPACLVSKSIWNKIESKYNNFTYESYDYDFDSNIVDKYNVGDTLPVVIFLDNDKEVLRIIGEKSEKEIISLIEGIL